MLFLTRIFTFEIISRKAIAPLAVRSNNSLTQHQRRMTKEYTLPPPALYLKLHFDKSLYFLLNLYQENSEPE